MIKAPHLSQRLIKKFDDDGFLLVRGALQQSDVARIDSWTDELVNRPEAPGQHWVYHEKSLRDDGANLISRIENMTPFHIGFAELADVLRTTVGQLLGEEAVLFKDKINFKMPGGDGFKPHQDSQAGWEEYANYYVSVMLCIDEATIPNGCLKLVKDGRKQLVGTTWQPLTEDETAEMDFVPHPTQPGDIIFLDCFAPHASEPNMTDSTRRLYFATYNRLSEGNHLERYFADKRASYPPDVEREPGKEYVFRV